MNACFQQRASLCDCPLPILSTANSSWSQRRDSNPRPADYKSAALPTELRWPCRCTATPAGKTAKYTDARQACKSQNARRSSKNIHNKERDKAAQARNTHFGLKISPEVLVRDLDAFFGRCHSQLAECSSFDLPNTLLRNPQLRSHFLQCLRLLTPIKTEAANDNGLLTLVKPR